MPEAGSVSVARALFYPSVGNAGIYCYDIQALLTTIQKGETSSTDEGLEMCRIISNEGNYKFCPGIDCREYYENYFSIIRYNIASVRIWDRPFERVDWVNCLLWHQLKHNATYEEKKVKKFCVDRVKDYALTLTISEEGLMLVHLSVLNDYNRLQIFNENFCPQLVDPSEE